MKILFAGRLVDFKDPITFIKAACYDSTRKFDFLVAGDGELMETCRKLAENCENVQLLGWLEQDAVNDLMRKVDIFCQMSPYENLWAATLISAMKNKRAIICTNAGYTSRYLKHDYHVVLIPPRDPNALAEAIVRLANDDKLRQTLGENASSFVRENLSTNEIVTEIREMLLDVVGSRK
jgi:glycosyltransferase involved in cell wall biosynthesis